MIEQIIAKLRDPTCWSKGKSVKTRDQVKAMCIGSTLESITELDDTSPYGDKMYSLVAQAIHELYPERWSPYLGGPIGGVVRFNDHPETTHEDVMKVLEHARQLEELAVAAS